MVKTSIHRLIAALFIIAAHILPLSAWSQGLDSPKTETAVFNPKFRTLKVQAADDFMLPPVIRMGTHDTLVINFDEIGEDNSWLEYRLVHCNRDWQPSALVESEYIDGFNSVRIEDFAFSTATFVHYVNYRIEIPNEDLRIIHSGNYLLQVFNPDTPETTVLQARFQVSENKTPIIVKGTSRTDRGYNSEWQQLEIGVDYASLGQANPYQDIAVAVIQNMLPDTRRVIPYPSRVAGKTAVYSHLPELIFPASNEYRRFESTSNSFAGMNVDSLKYMGSNYHVWLKPDQIRAHRPYEFDRTQHGRFMVREYNATDSDIGADYITAHFRLDTPRIPGAEVVVDGEFTSSMPAGANVMQFDPVSMSYVAGIPLKHGAYNYRYMVRNPDGTLSGNITEGNKYETENEYQAEVWFRPPGSRADRLAGFISTSFRP